MTPPDRAVLAAAVDDPGGLAGIVLDVVTALGVVGIGLLVALENVFPPIPSEVVLPLAGFLAAQGRFDPFTVWTSATAGSLGGALVLYWLGATVGRARIATAMDRAPLLDREDLDRATAWFDDHGGKAVLLGRLAPLVRSVVSIPAGVAGMPLPRFVLYTAIGSGAWNALFVGLGVLLGERWQAVGRASEWANAAVLAGLAVAVAAFVGRRLQSRQRSGARGAASRRSVRGRRGCDG